MSAEETITYEVPEFDADIPSPVTVIFALSLVLLAGTGAAVTVSQSGEYDAWASQPIITLVQTPSSEEAVASHHEMLHRVRVSLGLSMTDLAKLLSVSRPAAYAWFQGTSPRPEAGERLWSLYREAELIADLGLPRMDLLVKVPLRDGVSLYGHLLDGGSARDVLDQLQQVAASRETKAVTTRRTAKKAKQGEELLTSFSSFA